MENAKNVIILRYGELHLKGKNRSWFENKLVGDIKSKLKGLRYSFFLKRGRYLIADFEPEMQDEIITRCRKIFGLHSLSVACKCRADFEEIAQSCLRLVEERIVSIGSRLPNGNYETFKVVTNRADKNFEYNSMQINALIGARILEVNGDLRVDIHNPTFEVNIDVREEGYALVFSSTIPCAGGMPCGSAGKGLLLLSGGLDSPVAGHMMLRRGLSLDAIHFHSYPYTNERARQKVIELAGILSNFGGAINLHMVKLTRIQEEIKKNCDERYSVIVLRMVMMRLAEMMAEKHGCGCIINGESLGQVASQTLESLRVTDSMASIPVFRPLIGLDKQDIIEIARKIGTFEISILPFEDCCTIFLPKHPVTRPSKYIAAAEIAKIPDLDRLITEAMSQAEIVVIN